METEDRWYVRFRGHTLGPLTSEQVKSSVRRKELGPDDKLASTADPSWRPLRSQEEFLRCWEALTRPVPAELAPLPSPRILWQKKRAPLPAAPVRQAASPEIAARPAAPLSPAEPVSVPKPTEKKAARAAKPKKAKKAKKAPARRILKPKAPTLAAIPEKPPIVPATEPLVTAQPVASVRVEKPTAPSAQAAPIPKLAEETLSLLEALRDWNRKEKENSQVLSRVEPTPPHEASTREAALPLAAPRPLMPVAESPPAKEKARGIELRLNLVISKQFLFISSLIAALALAAILLAFTDLKKMRGPADSRLPDPSSPTVEPSPEDDPIPQLKAPTRPKRD
jgi:hypothetical protein